LAIRRYDRMQTKSWLLNGGIAAALALVLTYFILEPAPSIMTYGSLLGWSGILGVLAVTVQGYRKMKKRSASANHDGILRYKLDINRWGGVHAALSIAVTVLIAIHGALFLPAVAGLNLAIWLGASGFIVLVALNFSGIFTESKRKFPQFGSYKRLHVALMLIVLALSVIHVELLVGPSFLRSLIEGAIIAFAVAFVVFVSVPVTLHAATPR
jgi:hypothetical protein